MKNTVKVIYLAGSLLLLLYLSLPNLNFPSRPPDSLQSQEPGDTETPLRRAYFTDFTREEVVDMYQKQFSNSTFLNIPFVVTRLNYPPEEAQTIIRDQTRSTFLEELTHPLRESLFVNGFEPKSDKDAIYINGKFWKQKITVKLVPSSVYIRLLVGIAVIILIPTIFIELNNSLGILFVSVKKIWT